jgi:hypothetical protein
LEEENTVRGHLPTRVKSLYEKQAVFSGIECDNIGQVIMSINGDSKSLQLESIHVGVAHLVIGVANIEDARLFEETWVSDEVPNDRSLKLVVRSWRKRDFLIPGQHYGNSVTSLRIRFAGSKSVTHALKTPQFLCPLARAICLDETNEFWDWLITCVLAVRTSCRVIWVARE